MTAKKPRRTKTKRKIVYLEPGIYGMGMLSIMFPKNKYKIVITKDGKAPTKRKKRARK